MQVEQLMTRDVWMCGPEDTLAAARVMWERGCGCVPVVDGQLAGLLSLADPACEARRDIDSLAVALTLAGICQPRRDARRDGEVPLLA
ncbi:MAG: CBS domain-containing protein [Planctomycetes bacterium]|nr:CBS domain-containing protein [Planctomycetota bacterium]